MTDEEFYKDLSALGFSEDFLDALRQFNSALVDHPYENFVDFEAYECSYSVEPLEQLILLVNGFDSTEFHIL